MTTGSVVVVVDEAVDVVLVMLVAVFVTVAVAVVAVSKVVVVAFGVRALVRVVLDVGVFDVGKVDHSVDSVGTNVELTVEEIDVEGNVGTFDGGVLRSPDPLDASPSSRSSAMPPALPSPPPTPEGASRSSVSSIDPLPDHKSTAPVPSTLAAGVYAGVRVVVLRLL